MMFTKIQTVPFYRQSSFLKIQTIVKNDRQIAASSLVKYWKDILDFWVKLIRFHIIPT